MQWCNALTNCLKLAAYVLKTVRHHYTILISYTSDKPRICIKRLWMLTLLHCMSQSTLITRHRKSKFC